MTVQSLDINENASKLFTGSRDFSVRLWDVETGAQTWTQKINRNVVTDLKWIPREENILQVGEDLTLRVWDIRSGSLAQTLRSDNYFPWCCDVSDDGWYFLTSNNGFGGEGCEVKVWDRRKGAVLTVCKGHEEAVNACAFLPPGTTGSDSKMIVSSSKDSTIRTWDAMNGNCLSVTNMFSSSPQESPCGCITSLAATVEDNEGGVAVMAGCSAGFVGVWSHAGEGQLAHLHSTLSDQRII